MIKNTVKNMQVLYCSVKILADNLYVSTIQNNPPSVLFFPDWKNSLTENIRDSPDSHPGRAKKSNSYYQKRKLHNLFCKRAGIEPTIGHLKSDYRLGRNF